MPPRSSGAGPANASAPEAPGPEASTRGRPALFVDLDGTVRETKTGRVHPIEPWDQVVKVGVLEALVRFKADGYAVVGVTNQGGVAFGVLSEQDVRDINSHLMKELAPGLFDLILFCPYHQYGRLPDYRRDAECRKPRPGMAYEASARLGLDLSASIMVGDLDTDRKFARNAGIPTFYWANEFFGSPISALKPDA